LDTLAGAVDPAKRDAFIKAVANGLAAQGVVGPGAVTRIAGSLQKDFRRAEVAIGVAPHDGRRGRRYGEGKYA
jgi:hypothetical protein